MIFQMPNIKQILFLVVPLLIAGCIPSTADWHRRSALTGSAVPDDNPFAHGTRLIHRPPRGPLVPAEKLSQVHVGGSGDRIDGITHPAVPFYDGDLAFVTTTIHDRTYEVAFLYAPDHSGRIIGISYLPIPNAPRTPQNWTQFTK